MNPLILLLLPLTCLTAPTPQGPICPIAGCSSNPLPLPPSPPISPQLQNAIDSYITDINTITTDINQIPAALKLPDLLDRNIAITNLLVEIENTENDQTQYLNTIISSIITDKSLEPQDLHAAENSYTQILARLHGGSGGGFSGGNGNGVVKPENSFFARLQRMKDDPTGPEVLKTVQALGFDRNSFILPSILVLMRKVKTFAGPGVDFPATIPVPDA